MPIPFDQFTDFCQRVGVPAVALLCVLWMWFQSQKGLVKQMACMQRAIESLTSAIHDLIIIAKR